MTYATIVFLVAILWVQFYISPAPAASYHVAMLQQIFDLNGMTAGREVLTPNGELWHVDEVSISVQDVGINKVIIAPKISAHRVR
jgi:hypothetical protein